MRKRFPWWILTIPVSLVFVVVALYFLTAKWEQVHVEARTRCADPTVRKDRTVESCVSYLMSYYHIYSQLPKVGFGAVVSAQEQKAEAPTDRTIDLRRATVNLPGGQRFVAFGPKLGDMQTYITEPRPAGVRPRLLSIFRPGGSPNSWDVYIYIQEN